MLNSLKLLMISLLVLTSMVESYLSLWIISEILSLVSIYYVLESYKPFCRHTIIQFIFVIFQFSLLIIISVLLSTTFLILVSIMSKLSVIPFHSPIFSFSDLLNTHSFTYVFILPKFPYYIISEFSINFLVLPVLMILLLSLSFSLNENLIMSLTISSTLMLILFDHNIVLSLINFFMLIIWSLFLTSSSDYSNSEENSFLSILTLSTILPLPGSYSIIINYYLTSFPSLAVVDVVCLVVVSNLSLFFIIKYVSGLSKLTSSSLLSNGYLNKPWSMYTLSVYLMSLLLILWL